MHDPALSTAQHRELIEALALSHVLPHDTLPVEECLGRRLAVDVLSLIPLPPFTNSAMDGFAVRRDDLEGEGPWTLPVAGDIPAGDTRENRLERGQAWRIMTGAPIPEGADAVVKVEDTDHAAGIAQAPDTVEIRVAPKRGANVRVAGEALAAGSPVLEAGRILDGTALSAAASVGHGTLTVLPRPRVIVVSTGTELKHAGEALERGQIPDSNGILLRGLVEDAGGQVVAHLRTGDTPAELRRALDEAPEADLVLTAGGISAGAFEVVRLTLGTDAGFHHVAQQPGGPQGVGSTQVGAGGRETPVICLPGNPVSVFTTFHMYV
ncbi:MAG: molybdopterin molybdotransferase MoeA, partial [Thermobifida sp.]|nr:molybdopterin molybdotransferase MoeA [Thermobifida sp.]